MLKNLLGELQDERTNPNNDELKGKTALSKLFASTNR